MGTMILSAYDGKALGLTLILIAAIITVVVSRAAKRVDSTINRVLAKPAPTAEPTPELHAHVRFRCGVCSRAVQQCVTDPAEHIELLTRPTAPTCRSCLDTLAQLEKQLAS